MSSTTLVLSEIESGDGLTPAAAGKVTGGTHPATVFRWFTSGRRANDGVLVKLEACRIGGRWLTSRAAVLRFIERLNQPAEGAAAELRSPTARNKASEQAAKELVSMGC